MVRNFTLLLFSLLISFQGKAEKDSVCITKAGVYTDFSAFSANTYSDSICLNTKGDKLKLGNNSIVKIQTINGYKKNYKLGEIYGYFDGKDKYRYYYDDKNEAGLLGYFKIESQKGIIIYSNWALHGGTTYYYSTELDTPLKTLNYKNLIRDFTNENFNKELRALKETSKKKESALQVSALYNKYYPK